MMRYTEKYLVGICIIASLVYSTVIMAQKDGSRNIEFTKDSLPVADSNSFFSVPLPETADSVFIVRNIIIEGNKKTRDIIILRELTFKQGDSLDIKKIPSHFATSKRQLLNLSLFHEVNMSVVHFESHSIDVKIIVDERWYLFPLIYFKPVDRNLNQWLVKEKASFSRVDYGLKLMYENITGNNDDFKFYFITGYSRQIMIGYERPFIDKGLKWGFNFDIAMGKTREINYNTILDKQEFLKDGKDLRNFFTGRAELTYRRAIKTEHAFGIGYNTLKVGDSVIILNPNYFRQPVNKVKFPEVYYRLRYKDLDYIPYPTKGYAAEIFVGKYGFNSKENLWRLNVKGLGYWKINDKMFYNITAMGSLKLPFKQPFYDLQMLGYDDMILRGYQYYVIDGVAGGIVNTSLMRQLTDFNLHLPGTKWFTPRLIPLKIYGKVFGNVGYSHNTQRHFTNLNTLPNKLLWGGGFGFDIFTIYDFTLKVEFTFNQIGENGIFIDKKDIFH